MHQNHDSPKIPRSAFNIDFSIQCFFHVTTGLISLIEVLMEKFTFLETGQLREKIIDFDPSEKTDSREFAKSANNIDLSRYSNLFLRNYRHDFFNQSRNRKLLTCNISSD